MFDEDFIVRYHLTEQDIDAYLEDMANLRDEEWATEMVALEEEELEEFF